MDFNQREMQDGIRFSWNYWPNTKIGATRVVLPVGALYTPLKEIEGSAPVEYPPVNCKSCQSTLNPHCTIDYKFKTWICCICSSSNNFPTHYANAISPQSLPFELMPDYTTLEYVLPATNPQQVANVRPIFMLVVDTAIASEELAELKDSLQQSINFIPEDAMIGLITYGKMVYVHELGF
jgi:protein transport protein SEC23